MKRRLIRWLCAVVCAAVVSGCGVQLRGSVPKDLRVLTIGTADSGGTMYPAGKAIAQCLEQANESIKINVSASTGSNMNVQAIVNGEIDMGLVSADMAYAAFHGTAPFEKPMENLRVVAALYSSISNWIAPADVGAVYVHDLNGKRIGVGPQGSSTHLSVSKVADVLGLDMNTTEMINTGLGSGGERIIDGTLDAVHGFAGIPVEGMAELAARVPCRVLRFTAAELETILEQNDYYYWAVIPAGTYTGQINSVSTFGVKCLLCVDANMEEELVYRLTQTLYQSVEAMGEAHVALKAMSNGSFMYEDLVIPLHSGAERYYREQGLL